MAMRQICVLTVTALLLSCTSALYYKDVKKADFDKLLDPSKASIMIEFYAPWCGHLAPEYEQLGETFAMSQDVIIAQVDADKEKSLGKRFGIQGFPTIKWVQKGSTFKNIEEVKASRTAEDLLKFVNQKTGLSKSLKAGEESKVVKLSSDDFEDVATSKDNHAFVGFFAPWCGHCKAIKPTWEKLASIYADDDEVVIASVDCDANPALAEIYGIQGYPTFKYFGTDGQPTDYKGGRSIEDFVKLVNEKSGLELSSDGGVTSTAGVISELTDHVKQYLSASTPDEREQVMNTCQETVNTLDDRAKFNFAYYVKVFTKVAEKGVEYIKNEKARLSKMSSGSMKTKQRKNIMKRMNVLDSFSEL